MTVHFPAKTDVRNLFENVRLRLRHSASAHATGIMKYRVSYSIIPFVYAQTQCIVIDSTDNKRKL